MKRRTIACAVVVALVSLAGVHRVAEAQISPWLPLTLIESIEVDQSNTSLAWVKMQGVTNYTCPGVKSGSKGFAVTGTGQGESILMSALLAAFLAKIPVHLRVEKVTDADACRIGIMRMGR
jgi:hypothetical protein